MATIAIPKPPIYYPEFVDRIHELCPKWDPETESWLVDERNAQRAYAIMRECFGKAPGDPEPPKVRVRLEAAFTNRFKEERSLYALGRRLAYRPERDAWVKLGPGVVILSGRFPPKGGWHSKPELMGEDVVLEVDDVPISLARALAEKYPGEVFVDAEDLDPEDLLIEDLFTQAAKLSPEAQKRLIEKLQSLEQK